MSTGNSNEQLKNMAISKLDIEKLMYVFSHDLRNPLINMRALASDIQAILDDAGDDAAICRAVREDLPENLEMMHDVISRMDSLISGANDIYHGMFDELEPECVDLAEWVNREVSRKKNDLDSKGIEISLGELSTVWVDGLAMQRILQELLDNAVRFTERGGHISLYTEMRSGLDVLIVRDNGLGMSESDMERAFQPFFSTDRARSGIGLAVVKALLQAHGGRIWCESSIGKGSIFYVALPQNS